MIVNIHEGGQSTDSTEVRYLPPHINNQVLIILDCVDEGPRLCVCECSPKSKGKKITKEVHKETDDFKRRWSESPRSAKEMIRITFKD